MAKTLALVFGIVFLLVGVLGFVSNPLVGPGAVFATNIAHNIVHLLFGVLLVGCALRMPAQSGLWLKIIGALYLVIAVLGFSLVGDQGDLLGLITMNMADHLLHIVLGVVLIVAGFIGAKPASNITVSTGGPA